MAGITQKSCATLFPLWSLKKQWWGVYYKEIEVDKVSDSDIILTNDNTAANTVTATATTNNLNYNNNNYNST